MELGDVLRERRKTAGRTIASVAVDAGLSVPYIANLENGRGNPTLSALERLAAALGARLDVRIIDDPIEPPGRDQQPVRSVAEELLAASDRVDAVLAAVADGRSRVLVRRRLIATVDALEQLLGRAPSAADLNRLLDLLLLAQTRSLGGSGRP